MTPDKIDSERNVLELFSLRGQVAVVTGAGGHLETPYGLLSEGNTQAVAHVKILGNRIMRNELSIQAKNGKPDASFSFGPWGPSIEITDLDKKKKAALYPEIRGYLSTDWGNSFCRHIRPAAEGGKGIRGKGSSSPKGTGNQRARERDDRSIRGRGLRLGFG